ncbi:hypothetical protein BCL32_3704 [Rhizobium mongolense USDA 1844]|uniref:Uncharacterized protein n=1 Tax=Rhizobium mongolense USDA 1844 TaxID=1079460 RepID=A0A559SMG9_9HYPH|nr:hypothetical protein BCL32_3704 [Rhizobium mongolense USDA 1844]
MRRLAPEYYDMVVLKRWNYHCSEIHFPASFRSSMTTKAAFLTNSSTRVRDRYWAIQEAAFEGIDYEEVHGPYALLKSQLVSEESPDPLGAEFQLIGADIYCSDQLNAIPPTCWKYSYRKRIRFCGRIVPRIHQPRSAKNCFTAARLLNEGLSWRSFTLDFIRRSVPQDETESPGLAVNLRKARSSPPQIYVERNSLTVLSVRCSAFK